MSDIVVCKSSDNELIETVESLAKEIWLEYYTPIIGKTQVDYMIDKFQSKDAIRKQLDDGFFYYLIKEEKAFAGYFAIVFKQDHCFLSKLYVRSKSRGRGLAKQAIKFIENITKQNRLSKITLTVNKYNTDSIAAYQKLGFEITESMIMDIGNGFIMDDYVMSRCL